MMTDIFVTIYQMKSENEAKFMPLEFIDKYNLPLQMQDYKVVFQGYIIANEGIKDEAFCDAIYAMLQSRKIEGFTGHSLSVSDIVSFRDTYYFCDSHSWEDITSRLPTPILKKDEKYECLHDYMTDDESIAYTKGVVYQMANGGNLPDNSKDKHTMSNERDFYAYFKKVSD